MDVGLRSDFLFDYGSGFRRKQIAGVVREEFDMGSCSMSAAVLRDYREEVGAPDLEPAVSVSAV